MPDDIDKILNDIEAEKQAKIHKEDTERQLFTVDEQTAKKLSEERKNKVSEFKLQLDIDDEIADDISEDSGEGENTPDHAASQDNPAVGVQPEGLISEKTEADSQSKPKKQKSGVAGCIRGVIYAIIVLAVSGFLAYYLIVGALDMTGLFRSDIKVPVTLTSEQAKDISQVAKELKKAGVIEQPFMFELYCKLTGAADNIKPQDEASLSPDMGYREIINILRITERKTVKVMFPEGSTIDEIAKKLEKNDVCSATEFLLSLDNDEFDYDFLKEIPEGEAYKGRYRKYEGYIFPDSYEFYVGSSGKAVVRKFFDAFNNRVDATLRAKIKAKDMTLNDTIILASIIQWEAAKTKDMYGVSRVIHNRLNNPNLFPKLECDSTQRYVDLITPPVGGQRVENLDYDTYKRKGLPIGPINNPGLEAIKAAIDPSDDSSLKNCYFFATNMKTGETHFSKTLAEHEAWCRRNNIGIYADNG
ncbi:MAG: endolytic transglycosylase MltG [Clostridiales bacterium]|jgi:UPF0755 protein|nr:endolytic transglycosylase MltG [Clostridiales bacterium]